jgi:antibiotic biosynthesis monooxygenase (ABM) superfamily enzyme
MAQIISQEITIVISKLVKASQVDHIVITDEQLLTLAETLPGVVESLLEDEHVVVEITTTPT